MLGPQGIGMRNQQGDENVKVSQEFSNHKDKMGMKKLQLDIDTKKITI